MNRLRSAIAGIVLLGCIDGAFGAEGPVGKVTDVGDETVTVAIDSDAKVQVGDEVEIFYVIPGIDQEATVAYGAVQSVSKGSVEVNVTRRPAGAEVEPGFQARITSAQRPPTATDRARGKGRIGEMKGAVKAPAVAKPGAVWTNSIGMKLAYIPAGEFMMGSHASPEEVGTLLYTKGYIAYSSPGQYRAFYGNEHPLHRVRITKSFYMGACEITVGQFGRFVADSDYRTGAGYQGKGGWGFDAATGKFVQHPSFTWRNTGFHQTENHPVVNVSWNDAVAFCRWLSRKESKTYRLPTEAEWEYACRAGTTTWWWCGNDPEKLAEVANVADAAMKRKLKYKLTPAIKADDGYVFTAPVGSFKPNPFGLYDMHGNVWEWCADGIDREYYRTSPVDDPPGPTDGGARRFRGGVWGIYGTDIPRSATRHCNPPTWCGQTTGFRVVLELPSR